ncbi:MAG: tRNA-dihydrouridine synthase B [Lysobacterales bacterium]|jgi:tRNA-dihydrouridine synthase B
MKIAHIDIDKPICLAPMEDVTDQAFRIICRRMGADIVYTEFAASEALIRNIPKTLEKIQVCDEERPSAIQIFGGVEESMAKAAAKAEEANPDFLDINCGCWVKNVVARNEGAGLLRDLDKFQRIVRATISGTKLPVTVKTRLGWDEESIVILEVARMLEDIGVQAMTVHCRTRSQAHDKAPADWAWLTKIKQVINIPLIGNGDVICPQSAKRMLETGCDGVMVGRAAIGNPWIFRDIKHYLKTGELLPPPSIKERVDVLLTHLDLAIKDDVKNERRAISKFRKYISGYLKGVPNVAKLRIELYKHETKQGVIDRLHQYLDEISSLIV